jgi:hypothetical protein
MKKIFFVLAVILMAFAAAFIAGCQTSVDGKDLSGEAFSSALFQKKADNMTCADINSNMISVKKSIVSLDGQLKAAQSNSRPYTSTVKDIKEKIVAANKKFTILNNAYSIKKCAEGQTDQKGVCTDSDKGKTYSVPGACMYQTAESGFGQDDYCNYFAEKAGTMTRYGVLKEAYCGTDKCLVEDHPCSKGQICRSGLCRKGMPAEPICEDIDKGDIYVQGTTYSLETGGSKDTCYVSRSKENTDGPSTNYCSKEMLSSGEYCGVLEYYCTDSDHSSSNS